MIDVNYYDVHAKEYAELTVNADMSHAYEKFLRYLTLGAKLLDAGCGSGRDSLFFIKKVMTLPCWTLLPECASVRKR